MKKTNGTLMLLAVLAFGGCQKMETATPTTPPPAPAAMTPHPALASREHAIRLYPELARKGSVFNQAFLEIYAHRKKNDPISLTSPDWPVEIARRAADLLGEKRAQVMKATPPGKKAAPFSAANPLN